MHAFNSSSPFSGKGIAAIAALLGAWLTCGSLPAAPFANYVRFARTSPTTLDALFDLGPHPAEFGLPAPTDPPLPGWDANVVASVVTAGGPPVLDQSTLLLNVPVFNTFTLTAHDPMGSALGSLKLLAVGSFPIDLKASNALVNEAAGTIQVQLGGNLLQGQPAGIFSVQEAAGIYATDVLVVESFGYQGGYWRFPLDNDPNTSLQENILNAWNARQIIGSDIRAVITGTYIPEPSAVALLGLGLSSLCLLRRRWISHEQVTKLALSRSQAGHPRITAGFGPVISLPQEAS